jgi:hypothetical protein
MLLLEAVLEKLCLMFLFLARLSPRLVDDIYSSSIVRFGEDVTNKALMKDILKVSGEMDEAGDIAKLVKDKPDVNTAIIEDAMKELAMDQQKSSWPRQRDLVLI